MDVALVLETDIEALGRSHLIDEISGHLTRCFSERAYGNDVESVHIGVICKRIRPGFEAFAKVRRPKHVAHEEVNLIAGGTRRYTNVFTYDVRFEADAYHDFVNADEETAAAILVSILTKSISNVDQLPKRVNHFDKESFKCDFVKCLRDWSRVR